MLKGVVTSSDSNPHTHHCRIHIPHSTEAWIYIWRWKKGKIKRYKKQIEEAEEIAALNLAKYRKAQQELEETEDRSKNAEGQLHEAQRMPQDFMAS